jgi:2-alkenal reductase
LRPFDPRTRQIGDVIVAVDGKATPTLADLAAALDDAGIGKEVTLKVLRGDVEREAKVRVIDVGG